MLKNEQYQINSVIPKTQILGYNLGILNGFLEIWSGFESDLMHHNYAAYITS